MKAWIGISIISTNKGFLAAIENIMPYRLDNRLWDSDEYVLERSMTMEGIEVFNASLFFKDFNERANFKSALGGITGFLHAALPGSFLKTAKSWHDDKLPNGCPKKQDELEYSEIVI